MPQHIRSLGRWLFGLALTAWLGVHLVRGQESAFRYQDLVLYVGMGTGLLLWSAVKVWERRHLPRSAESPRQHHGYLLLTEGAVIRAEATRATRDAEVGLNSKAWDWADRVETYIGNYAPDRLDELDQLPSLERLGYGVSDYIEPPSRKTPAFMDARTRLIRSIMEGEKGSHGSR